MRTTIFSKAKALFAAALATVAAKVLPSPAPIQAPAPVLRRTMELQKFGNTAVQLVHEAPIAAPLTPHLGGRGRTSGIPYPGRTTARSLRTAGARFSRIAKH